jgi:hypothetical protein
VGAVAARRLRAVPANETPPAKKAASRRASRAKAKSVTQAAKSGSTRELLVAMRDRTAIAVENPNTPARDLAALTKRLMELVREIEAIDARAKEDGDDAAPVEDGDFDASAV